MRGLPNRRPACGKRESDPWSDPQNLGGEPILGVFTGPPNVWGTCFGIEALAKETQGRGREMTNFFVCGPIRFKIGHRRDPPRGWTGLKLPGDHDIVDAATVWN